MHVNRWGDGSAHLHLWFLARPYGRLQLRGTFLSLWDDILPEVPENKWREDLALVAAWLGEFGGRPIAEPPHIEWQSPSTIAVELSSIEPPGSLDDHATTPPAGATRGESQIRNGDGPPSDANVDDGKSDSAVPPPNGLDDRTSGQHDRQAEQQS